MKTISEIDFSKFCEPEYPSISKPWVVSGWKYACDGRIAVRIPFRGPDSPTPEGRPRPDLPSLFRDFECADGFVAFPAVEQCRECKGEGKYIGECTSCRGRCDCECRCGDLHDCGECDGSGRTEISCGCVNDEGRYVQLGAAWINGRFAWLIACLPKPEFVPQPNADERILFRFEGGQGIVMPVLKGIA
jgi:hypothetical protein